LSYLEALDLLGKERPKKGRKSRQDYLNKRHERQKSSWWQSDLAWTLGTLIRVGHQAVKALTPINFDEYCGILDDLSNRERWHDILIFGSSEDKKALMNELEAFPVFERGRLWREDFDYDGWLRKQQSFSIPAIKKRSNISDLNIFSKVGEI
jgi:hypothetical protein